LNATDGSFPLPLLQSASDFICGIDVVWIAKTKPPAGG